MLVHTEHLIPGMTLEKDIELQAGSYLITRAELGDGRLTENVIRSIQKFSGSLSPYRGRVYIHEDEIAFKYIQKIVKEDLNRIIESVVSGKEYKNFLSDNELRKKVIRIIDILFSNPSISRVMYDTKFNTSEASSPVDLIFDHSIRSSLLAIAIGLRMRLSIVSLVTLGVAALMHDLGTIASKDHEPVFNSLDEFSAEEIAVFIKDHQERSVNIFQANAEGINQYQNREIIQIISNHHSLNLTDLKHKNTVLFHFADLVDEMVSVMPHQVRFNFTPSQLEIIGKEYGKRCSLNQLLLALAKLYSQKDSLNWEIINHLASLFGMKALLGENFDIKLQKILEKCPFKAARVYPSLDDNSIPRMVYCSKSHDEDFHCEYLLFVNVNIQGTDNRSREFYKCNTLGSSLGDLLKEQRD